MHVSLRRVVTGAFIAGLTCVTPLWSTAQAQSFASDDVSRATSAEAEMTTHTTFPTPARGGAIFDNGGIKTGTTTSSGVTVPTAGYEWSEVQNDAGNLTESNTSAGSTCTGAFRLADDFSVPAGETWTLDAITTYGYQTGWASASTVVTAATLRIWDGPPGEVGSTIIHGDATTNVMGASVEDMTYRVFNTSVPPPGSAPGTTRRVWRTDINVAPALDLTEGTYWVDWAYTAAGTGTMFCPTVTVVGDRGLPGWNGRQRTVAGPPETWVAVLDAGNPAAAPDEPQDFPFQIHGTVSGGGPCTPSSTVFCSADTPLSIPDNLPAGVTSTITVVPLGTLIIDDLDIGFGSTHSWAGDLRADVSHGATTVTVYDRPGVPTTTFGCSGDNPTLTMDDEGTGGAVETSCTNTTVAYPPGVNYTPNNPLSAFDGLDASGTWTMTVSDNAAGDTGSLDYWSLIITPGSGPTINTYTNDPDPNTPVPDNNPTGITSVITVPPSPNIVLDVDVQLTTTHSWAGDLAANLNHGAANSLFYDRPGVPTTTFGCSGDNPTLTVDDEGTGGAVETSCTNTTTAYPPGVNYTPNNPLSVFDNMDVEGNWTLTLSDNAAGDTGTLNSWSIIVTEGLDTAGPQDPGAAVATLRALPNPMTAGGTIELTVPTAQHVRVAVYDMLGREVMMVLDRDVTADQRVLIGIMADRLEAGAYVIRAIGESFQTTQRMTVTR